MKKKGVITAMVTPFEGDKLDLNCFELLINKQINTGIEGIVIAGSTGEGSLLTKQEYQELLNCAVSINDNRASVIACCSHTSTRYVLNLAQIAQQSGVHGILCTVPHYVKPSQIGMFEHFKTIHDNVDLPIILYNIPSRTGADLSEDVILELAKLPKIIAIKESSSNFTKVLDLNIKLPNFSIFAGDDINALLFYIHGVSGLVSVLSNLYPDTIKNIYEFFMECKIKESIALQKKLLSLYKVLSLEPNPVGIKYIMSLFNLCKAEVRLPLSMPSKENQELLKKTIDTLYDLS